MNSPSRTQELARDLGLLEAYTMGVGTMIGAGIFVLPSIAAANAGPASMVSFAVGGVVSLLAALSLSELATGMPRAGGSYYYVNHALGGFFGSVVGWGMWTGLMFATAFYMLGFGQYLTFFWGAVPVAGAALVMAALLVYLNFRGVKETGAVQNVIVVLLLGFIAVFAGVGLFQVDLATLRPFNPRGWGSVAATAATVYVAFIGFEVIASSAEEIRDPGRNLPLAMIASVLTPTVLYVLVMLVSTGVLPVPALAESRIPVADVARKFMGPVGALLMVAGAVLATVSSANASILSAARVNFAMGRDRILTNWLNEVHRRFRTPYRAILVTGGVILALIAAGVGLETLADVASFTYLMTYACVHVAVVVMRRADPPEYEPSFRLRGVLYPAVPSLGLVSCLVVMATMRPVVLGLGAVVVGLGVGWYWLYARERAVKPSLVGEAIAGPAGRPAGAGRRYRVVVPVANPTTERPLLRMAAEAARDREEPELVAVNVIEVPPQTALGQQLEFEEERVEMQWELLDSARDAAAELGVGVRTRALVGRDVGEAVVDVVREERADQVFVGWSGKRSRARHVLGSAIDPIVEGSECEVTLVKPGEEAVDRVVALVGEGPHAALAVQRALAFARAREAELVLANVQPPDAGADGGDPETEGRLLIRRVGDRAGVDPDEYRGEVWVGDDVTEAILPRLGPGDLTCVGATRSTSLTQALFGSIPEEIGARAPGTVAIVRGREYRPRSLVDALVERLLQR